LNVSLLLLLDLFKTCNVCVAGEVGLIVETMGGDETEVGGTVPQRISSCMEALGTLLALPHAVAASMVPADKRRVAVAPTQDLVHAVANILGEISVLHLLYGPIIISAYNNSKIKKHQI